MLRHSPIGRLLWLLAIALLIVRVGDAHLHLCLDGKSSAVAMHVEDAPTHNGEESANGHNDRDLDLSVPQWAKKAGLDEMPVILLAALVLVLLLPTLNGTLRPARLRLPILVPVFALRPPLRGPPL